MSDRLASDPQNRQKIDDWLLALLRFAITRNTADRTAAIEFARLLDARETGANWSGTFFVRTYQNLQKRPNTAEVTPRNTPLGNPV